MRLKDSIPAIARRTPAMSQLATETSKAADNKILLSADELRKIDG
jgi:hypothetical protein